MISGSLIGAAIGGLAVAFAPTSFLKGLLGTVLIIAAVETMMHGKNPPSR